MKFYWLVLGALAVWRVTHLLHAEDGPRGALAGLRRIAGRGAWGDLLDCFYCLSLWIAIPFAWWLGDGWKERLLLWPALSAAGVAIERAMEALPPRERAEHGPASPALYFEHPEEEEDVVLRKEEGRREAGGHAARPVQ